MNIKKILSNEELEELMNLEEIETEEENEFHDDGLESYEIVGDY